MDDRDRPVQRRDGGDEPPSTSVRSPLLNSFGGRRGGPPHGRSAVTARGSLTVWIWRSPISSPARSRPLTQAVRMAIRAPKTKKGPKGKDPRLWFSRPMATANAAMLHATSTPVPSAESPTQAR
jgi:hypothetical protein